MNYPSKRFARQGGSPYANEGKIRGANGIPPHQIYYPIQTDKYMAASTEVNKTLQPVHEDDATLEAEKGERVVMPNQGMPTLFNIGGKRHSEGGTPLNLPAHSFIFSRDKSMKISDPDILAQFNVAAKKSGVTPADIAKKYDINKFRKILADKDSDPLQRETAEAMIASYTDKLAKLSLVQESHKGFPNGVPSLAIPYMEKNGLSPEHLFQQQSQDDENEEQPSEEQARYGMNVIPEMYRNHYQLFGGAAPMFKKGGQAPTPVDNKGQIKIQYAGPITKEGYNRDEEFSKEKKTGGENKRRVKVIAPESNTFQSGGQPPKGIPTYDAAEQAILKQIFPDITLPEDVVEAKQATNKDKTYGRFNKDAADKNWSWYGKKIDWNNPVEVGAAQKAYNNRIHKKLVDAGYPADFANQMVSRVGFIPEKGKPNSLDNLAGKYTETRTDAEVAKAAKAAAAATVDAKKSQKPGAILTNTVVGRNEQTPADFWLQDIVKTVGAAGDMERIKKYMPWQGSYNPYLATPTFYDPTRELAANAEQSNIAATATGMFSGPQALAARLSGIQGQGAANAANILGKYNNLNVGVANQFENINTGIENQAGMNKADAATRLYDKTVLTNQNFDNAKAMARQNLRGSFIDAITNRAQTQALNTIFPQYHVNPLTGGTEYFTSKGKKITPEASENDALFSKIEDSVRRFPGTTAEDWAKIYTKGS
jgi:hypothetical protein